MAWLAWYPSSPLAAPQAGGPKPRQHNYKAGVAFRQTVSIYGAQIGTHRREAEAAAAAQEPRLTSLPSRKLSELPPPGVSSAGWRRVVPLPAAAIARLQRGALLAPTTSGAAGAAAAKSACCVPSLHSHRSNKPWASCWLTCASCATGWKLRPRCRTCRPTAPRQGLICCVLGAVVGGCSRCRCNPPSPWRRMLRTCTRSQVCSARPFCPPFLICPAGCG